MRYATTIQLDPSATSLPFHGFRANSCFDPDFTGAGHSALGFDQYVGIFYDHYTVVGSKISITIVSTNTTTPVIVVLDLNEDASGAVEIDTEIENNKCQYAIVTGTNNNPVRRMRKTFSCKKFFSVAHPIGHHDYAGSLGANPSEQAYYTITAQFFTGVDPTPIDIKVCIDYLVVLWEPRDLTQS